MTESSASSPPSQSVLIATVFAAFAPQCVVPVAAAATDADSIIVRHHHEAEVFRTNLPRQFAVSEESSVAGFASLRAIGPDWPLDGPTIGAAESIARAALRAGVINSPMVFPTRAGGVELEWNQDGWDVSLTADPGASIYVHASRSTDPDDACDEELELGIDEAACIAALSRFLSQLKASSFIG